MAVDTSKIQKESSNRGNMIMVTISDFGYISTTSMDINTKDEIEITSSVTNFDDLSVRMSRNGLSGIIVESSFPIRYAKEAYIFIGDLFNKHGIYATAKINVYLRDKVNITAYNSKDSFRLDFTTINIDVKSKILSINMVSDNINGYIKSNGRTKYDIPVSEISTSFGAWRYDRIPLKENVNFVPISGEFPANYVPGYQPAIYVGSSELAHPSVHEFITQEAKDIGDWSPITYFFKAGKKDDILIKLSLKVRNNIDNTTTMILYRNNNRLETWDIEYNQEITATYNGWVTVNAGDTFSILFWTATQQGDNPYLDIIIFEDQNINLSFSTAGNSVWIDVIRPGDLLNRLLNEITGRSDITGSIEWGDREKEYDLMLCAAESVRGLSNPNIHTSFNEFSDWMNVMGYIGEYPDNKSILFRPIGNSFDKTKTILSLNERENTGLSIESDDEFAYTSLEIGYDTPNYENVNGRFEVNGTFDYSTGFVSPAENKLSLISPYRADPMGIEFLCLERPEEGKETTDDKSDNDVFAVALKYTVEQTGGPGGIINVLYKAYTGVTVTVEGITMFNAILNPYYLVQNNLKRLGISTGNLLFTGTTSNRSGRLSTGVNYMSNIKISDKLFEPIVYQIDAIYNPSVFIYENRNGLIEFYYGGVKRMGFLKSALRKFGHKSEASLLLFAVK